jgi:hypothetical protein
MKAPTPPFKDTQHYVLTLPILPIHTANFSNQTDSEPSPFITLPPALLTIHRARRAVRNEKWHPWTVSVMLPDLIIKWRVGSEATGLTTFVALTEWRLDLQNMVPSIFDEHRLVPQIHGSYLEKSKRLRRRSSLNHKTTITLQSSGHFRYYQV